MTLGQVVPLLLQARAARHTRLPGVGQRKGPLNFHAYFVSLSHSKTSAHAKGQTLHHCGRVIIVSSASLIMSQVAKGSGPCYDPQLNTLSTHTFGGSQGARDSLYQYNKGS